MSRGIQRTITVAGNECINNTHIFAAFHISNWYLCLSTSVPALPASLIFLPAEDRPSSLELIKIPQSHLITISFKEFLDCISAIIGDYYWIFSSSISRGTCI